MDELLKALAEAIRQGSHLAMPALVGYYVVRIAEAMGSLLSIVGVAWMAKQTILGGMTIYHEKNAGIWIEKRKSHEAYEKAWNTTKGAIGGRFEE